MATVTIDCGTHVHEATPEEGKAIVDRAARRYLGMSGEAFLSAWDACQIEDPDRPEVMRVAMPLPFACPERV